MPNREQPCLPGQKTAIKYSFWILRPFFDSAINSWRFKILSAFVKENRNGQTSWLNFKKSNSGNKWVSRKKKRNSPLDLHAPVLS
jgi:hypothetical protein